MPISILYDEWHETSALEEGAEGRKML